MPENPTPRREKSGDFPRVVGQPTSFQSASTHDQHVTFTSNATAPFLWAVQPHFCRALIHRCFPASPPLPHRPPHPRRALFPREPRRVFPARSGRSPTAESPRRVPLTPLNRRATRAADPEAHTLANSGSHLSQPRLPEFKTDLRRQTQTPNLSTRPPLPKIPSEDKLQDRTHASAPQCK